MRFSTIDFDVIHNFTLKDNKKLILAHFHLTVRVVIIQN